MKGPQDLLLDCQDSHKCTDWSPVSRVVLPTSHPSIIRESSATHPYSRWLPIFKLFEDAEYVVQYLSERGDGAILIIIRKPNLGYGRHLSDTKCSR